MTTRDEGEYNTDCRFTGQLFDTHTKLYYYGARYYDPDLGRFISPDTIVPYPSDPQAFNRYAYARNNPIRYVDPSGHSWIVALVAAAIGAAIGAVAAHEAGGNVWAGAAMGAACGYFGAGIANIATSAMGISILSGAGTGAGAAAAGSWGGSLITPLEGALITGAEFAIGGFATGLASGYAGGAGSIGDMFTQAGMGAVAGFGSGFAIGYSYTAGWQSVLHGANTAAHNSRVIEAQRRRVANMTAMLDQARKSKGLLGKINTDKFIVKYNINPTSEALARQARLEYLQSSLAASESRGPNWKTIAIGLGEVVLGVGTIIGGLATGASVTAATGGGGLGPAIISAGSMVTTGLSLSALGVGEIVNGWTGGESLTVDALRTYYNTPSEATAVDIFR